MKTRISLSILIMAFAVLIAAMQSPLLLAGGSDAGEVIVAPTRISQWLALLFFAFFVLFPVDRTPLKKSYTITLKGILVATSLLFLVVSGHTYRYSDRAHALIDTWYFIPVQTIEINPDTYLNNAEYRIGTFFIQVEVDDHSRQLILSGPHPFGINKQETIDLLKSFGFKGINK